MERNVEIPQLGESITEATLSRWLKSDGEQVSVDEPLCELESDKATVELPSPASGKLKHLKEEGTAVKIGESVAVIDEEAQEKKEATAQPERREEKKLEAVKPPAAKAEVPPKPEENEEEAPAEPLPEEKEVEPEVLKPPPAEKEAPIKAVEEERQPTKETEDVKRIPMSRIRKTIAERLVRSQREAAILTTFNEADMSEVLAIRERHGEEFKKAHGVSLGLMSFFVRAVTSALRNFPILNASIEGNDIAYHNAVHMGIAVSTDRGLVVPVLKNADSMSFSKVESEIQRIAETARNGKLTLADLSGGTFTITNGGIFGSLLSTPLLNPPQAGILGMHTIQKRAHVLADDRIEARPMMYLALSYDHRLVDGREAVQFLISVKDFIEDPVRFLLSEERFSTSDKALAVNDSRSSAA